MTGRRAQRGCGAPLRRAIYSEGAIVRLALREYLDKQRPKGTR